MRFLSSVGLAFPILAASREVAVDAERAARLYDSGVVHRKLMAAKESTFARQEAAGAYNSAQWSAIDTFVPCVDGKATVVEGDPMQTFRCNKADLYHFLPHSELGSRTGQGSSTWGWTSPEGREIVAIGQADGAAFVEISKEGKIVYLGRLPQPQGVEPRIWREIRGYKNYMIIGSEAVNHYVQIFDLTKLLDIDPANPKTFNPTTDVTGWFKGLPIGRTHNIVVNEETDFAYAVGAQPRDSACKSGLIFIDVSDPSNPTSPGCDAQDGYVHDAQCVIYHGPDTRFEGREVCYGYNEDSLTIYDVTDKSNSKVISRTSYQGASYTHQGWLLNKEHQEWLLLDDEYDEFDRVEPAADGHPVTYIWNIANLSAPIQTGYYKSKAYSVDHNQYVIDGYSYQSNYGAGLRVLDVTSIPDDPTGKSVSEIAFFDIYPEDDSEPNGGVIDFVGTWGSYAFFKSGFILINTIERGAFVVALQEDAFHPSMERRSRAAERAVKRALSNA
ncbi:hypothetical protein M501DRAFT_937101 [Patellaria atrata CBS 101060]|uniref:Regulatory P domain-containing protein n=1 Tax=Patellaria atrata CBS 101060 TaxID=1346257 RepID=A0A9P4S7X8_9PEZI|nr:hypothetical protein M501DRAFT_937101 [Patellaria atrata CBS 101060]